MLVSRLAGPAVRLATTLAIGAATLFTLVPAPAAAASARPAEGDER